MTLGTALGARVRTTLGIVLGGRGRTILGTALMALFPLHIMQEGTCAMSGAALQILWRQAQGAVMKLPDARLPFRTVGIIWQEAQEPRRYIGVPACLPDTMAPRIPAEWEIPEELRIPAEWRLPGEATDTILLSAGVLRPVTGPEVRPVRLHHANHPDIAALLLQQWKATTAVPNIHAHLQAADLPTVNLQGAVTRAETVIREVLHAAVIREARQVAGIQAEADIQAEAAPAEVFPVAAAGTADRDRPT